jgi:hypothetical protein
MCVNLKSQDIGVYASKEEWHTKILSIGLLKHL